MKSISSVAPSISWRPAIRFPGSFDWPHLLIYLDTLVLATYYTVGKIAGSYDRVMDFLFEAVVLNPGLHYRICRVVGVVFGVATVAVTYLVGRRAYGSRAALLASAALATCYLHVRDSRFATPDVPVTFFVALSLLFAILAVEKPSVTRFVLSGVFAGLATSTKYHAGLVVLSVAAAGWAAWRRPEGNLTVRAVTLRLLVAGVGFSLAFALSSPYAVLRYPALVRALGGLTGLHYRPEGTSALWEHISVTLPYGLGWPFFLAAMAGVVRALWLRRAADWVLLAFCLSFFGFISALTSVFPRYVVPLTPLFALFAADFVDGLLKAREARALASLRCGCDRSYRAWALGVGSVRPPRGSEGHTPTRLRVGRGECCSAIGDSLVRRLRSSSHQQRPSSP